MLAIGPESEYGKFANAVLLAKTENNPIWYIPSEDDSELPHQRVSGHVFDLIPTEDFHKICKRWGLTKKESNALRAFFSQRQDDIFINDILKKTM